MEYHGLKLDPFQEKAIQAIQNNQSVLVAAPTGAGKTLIAEYALEKSLEENRGIIYTAPIKALSNQKFRDFSRQYGDHIGILTGDVTINPEAPVLIMTTEIFRNTVVDEPERFNNISYVIFDEVHYLDDEERGTVWEESIIFAPPEMKIIALSATVPNIQTLARWIRAVRKDNLVVVEEYERPVPLKHLLFLQDIGVGNLKTLQKADNKFCREPQGFKAYAPRISHAPSPSRWSGPAQQGFRAGHWKDALLDYLVKQDQLPCLYFLFNRKDCEKRAGDNVNRKLLTGAEQSRMEQTFNELCRRYNLDSADYSVRSLYNLVRHGIAFHHAGMLPSLKEIVERLFTGGLIKLLFATETFAVGVNMPARSVVFDELGKFNGVNWNFLKSREYQQMAGRSGRRGMDEVGFVYGYVEKPYVRPQTVERIISGPTEPVRSQFNLTYASLLNLYHTLKDNVYTVCQKSLSNFQSTGPAPRTKKGRRAYGKKVSGVCFSETVEQVRRKLRFLERLNYIRDGRLTRLGHFARQIYGNELIISEVFRAGILEQLNPDELNLLAVAMVFESRRREHYRVLAPELLNRLRKPLMEISHRVIREEKHSGIAELSREPDLHLSGATYAWSTGTPFDKLVEWTNASQGDLVRAFRRAIQMLHQMERAYRSIDVAPPTIALVKEAIARLKRDEVDAEKYLLMQEE